MLHYSINLQQFWRRNIHVKEDINDLTLLEMSTIEKF